MPIVKPKQGDELPRAYYEPGMKREDWEQQVFDRATLFTVVRKVGPAKLERKEFISLARAMRAAIIRQGGTWRRDPRAMLYAVDPHGSSFCIPPQEWKVYLDRWEANKRSAAKNL